MPTKCFFVSIAVQWSNFFFCRKRKALCERSFALHGQQPEKYKQNVEVATPRKKFLRMPMERGLGAILTKVCRSLLYAVLLIGASAS